MLHYVEKPDNKLKEIVSSCFPEYCGKKYMISTDIPTDLSSYWDEGNITYYAFYSLVNGKQFKVETNHPMFEKGNPNRLEKLPERVLLLEYRISRGKGVGVIIHANPSDLAPMLPKTEDELDTDEAIVLTFTTAYKPSYAGISNLRFHEANLVHKISWERWSVARHECIKKGYLDKRGAITPKGRNVIQGKRVEI